jgi:hypothetical protein
MIQRLLPYNTTTDDDDESLEICMLSPDDISKVSPFFWPADTGASCQIYDQFSICRYIISTKHCQIEIRGVVLYFEAKGTVDLKSNDGLLIVLRIILYVPILGVNLLLANHLYKTGLVGSFNLNKMYFKLKKKMVIKATIKNNLYIINHILK